MGRIKATPVKCKTYIKKRKHNRVSIDDISYQVSLPRESNRQYYLGNLALGTTNNIVPAGYTKLSFKFKQSNDENEEFVILQFDLSTVVIVKLLVESELIEGIVKTKMFALNVLSIEEHVCIDIYLVSIPLQKYSTKVAFTLKTLFSLFYGISLNNSEENENKELHLYGKSEIETLYEKITEIRDKSFIPKINVQHNQLKPLLRPYQEDAIRWMLYREKQPTTESDHLHPLYTCVTLMSGLQVYYDKYSGDVQLTKPLVPVSSKGGILADEMGLGKTVEILACILAHPKEKLDLDENSCEENENSIIQDKKIMDIDEKLENHSPQIDKQFKKRRLPDDIFVKYVLDGKAKKLKVPDDRVKGSSKQSSTKLALTAWYNSILGGMSTARHCEKKQTQVECICGSSSEQGLVLCGECHKYQHGTCLGYKKSFGKYRCPQCWLDSPLIESGATLIITPLTLRTQWCNEICKHINGGLKVLIYEGSSATPVYPTQLKEYDIVISTYNVLQAELRLTECGEALSLRNQRKYSPPGSPLTCIKWWRLCLDEAQTVETPGRMVSAMAQKLSANFRWAVTGTPVSKDVSDLYGLIDYLFITPHNDFSTWKNILYEPYTKGNCKPMYTFLSQILWRSSKESVLDQINIPKQTFKEHFLEFSAVEKFFYRREHELSCNEFLAKLHGLDTRLPLHSLDKKTLKKILAPLFALRQACTHPNTARGRYLATKKQVTSMKELLDALIVKNTNECEESLRLIISSLNGLAGIHLLHQNLTEAINKYRKVLQLYVKYTTEEKDLSLTIDKLQVIHTMHNLAETLDTYPAPEHTLRDGTLRKDCVELEKKYIEKFIVQTMAAYNETTRTTAAVTKLQNQFVLKPGTWYADAIEWISANNQFEELMNKIQSSTHTASVKCTITYSDERNILQFVYAWDEWITELRDATFETISKMYTHNPKEEYAITVSKDLVSKAMECHLRPEKNSKKQKKCLVCEANDNLKKYEAKLFSMTKRKALFEDMALIGSWKPTLEELVLKSILSVLKSRNGEEDVVKDGETHIQIIELLKKEFKDVRKFWTYLDQQICARDELNICKIRLQLKDSSEEDKPSEKRNVLKNLSYNVDSKLENVNLLAVHELDYQISLLQGDEKLNLEKLEKCLGTRSYLQTLRKQQYEGQSPDPCPICKNVLENHWSILPCGHGYCMECIQILLEQIYLGKYLQCSICRTKQEVNNISYIKAHTVEKHEDETEIKGNYSTKIEAVIRLILELKEEDPGVKLLLFSSWISVLRNIGDALNKNNIRAESVFTSNTVEKKIEIFKNPSQGVMVLLLPVNQGAKGLNLVEATHVILVEPILDPAAELQAIGRVHRIGQTKPTVVHKFLIKNTIEESIYQATTSNAASWDKNKVNLTQLIKLFTNSDVLENIEEVADLEQSQGSQ